MADETDRSGDLTGDEFIKFLAGIRGGFDEIDLERQQSRDFVEAGLGFVPVIGEALSGKMLLEGVRDKDAGKIGFGALGLLPVVGLAGRLTRGSKTAKAIGTVGASVPTEGTRTAKLGEVLSKQRGSLGGVRIAKISKTARAMLAEALEMERKGATPYQTWAKTNWWRSFDGKMRFEFSDFGFKDRIPLREFMEKPLSTEGDRIGLAGGLRGPELKSYLSHLVNHESFFKAYPELANAKVTLRKGPFVNGFFNVSVRELAADEYDEVIRPILKKYKIAENIRNEEKLSAFTHRMLTENKGKLTAQDLATFEDTLRKRYYIDLEAPDLPSMREALIHEMNHGIQSIEGFARGGSVEYEEEFLQGLLARQERLAKARELSFKRGYVDMTKSLQEQYNSVSQVVDGLRGRPAFERYRSLLGEAHSRLAEGSYANKLEASDLRKRFPDTALDVEKVTVIPR